MNNRFSRHSNSCRIAAPQGIAASCLKSSFKQAGLLHLPSRHLTAVYELTTTGGRQSPRAAIRWLVAGVYSRSSDDPRHVSHFVQFNPTAPHERMRIDA